MSAENTVRIGSRDIAIPSEKEWNSDEHEPFTFFPNPGEHLALSGYSPRGIASLMQEQSNLAARFLHFAIGRNMEYARRVVDVLGPELASELVRNDISDAITIMLNDFVPEIQIKQYLDSLSALHIQAPDLSELGEQRQINSVGIPELKPIYSELTEYLGRIRNNRLYIYNKTSDVRILDSERGFRYVGFGNVKGNTGVLDIFGIDGRHRYSGVVFCDTGLQMAIIRR